MVYKGKTKGLLLGNYKILDKLGQGGMGMVLKAEHQRMGRLVALKVLSPTVTKNADAVLRFQREVRAAAKLEHSNIVTAYDADEASGTHFLVMQFVDGRDLSQVVKQKGAMPFDKAVNCVLQAARGLEYAHSQGVVHRDIKPANLLLDRTGTVKILDMGLARLDNASAGEQAELTGTGQIMGTIDYMAPEQALNTKDADARSDIYSLGITLWYLMTGRAAYDGETLTSKLLAHQQAPIPSLCTATEAATPELDAVFRKMVAKDAGERFQSMTEVIEALETCLSPSGSKSLSVSVGASEESKLNEFLDWVGDHGDQPSISVSQAKAKVSRRTESTPDHTVNVTSGGRGYGRHH